LSTGDILRSEWTSVPTGISQGVVQQYQEVKQSSSHEKIPRFFGGEPAIKEFPNQQHFDFDGLVGRSLSSSYAPLVGHPNHALLVEGLQHLFDTFAVNGRIHFQYQTRVYYGRFQ
jgi:hypothetical protein